MHNINGTVSPKASTPPLGAVAVLRTYLVALQGVKQVPIRSIVDQHAVPNSRNDLRAICSH